MSLTKSQHNIFENLNFIDLAAQQQSIKENLERAVLKVLEHGNYIMGPEVQELENELASFVGCKHAISCANGTDALHLVLRAKGIGPGDMVFVPSFTFAASAEAVKLVGATPCFVDVSEDTFNMDPNSLKQAINIAREHKLNPKAIMAVDMFGCPADYDAINKIAAENDLWLLSDSAQGFGSEYNNQKSGMHALATTTSFFPAKPLGCYGDGGCIFTDDDELAEILQSLRVHGKGSDKYDNIRIGLNSRLDTLQAAILLEKLKVFPQELKHRQQVADTYSKNLLDFVKTPLVQKNYKSAWAQYTIVLPKGLDRVKIMAELKQVGIPSMVYYIKPLHLQTAYSKEPRVTDSLSITENLADRVVSLPMDGYLNLEVAQAISEKLVDIINDNK